MTAVVGDAPPFWLTVGDPGEFPVASPPTSRLAIPDGGRRHHAAGDCGEPLDISLTPSGTRGYDDLRRDAVEVTVREASVLLASLADIVRSKDAAGRGKDRRALPVLRELLARETRRLAEGR